MKRVQKVLVCMDLTPDDEALIVYASRLCAVSQTAQVYFLHVTRDLDIPDEIREQFPDLAVSTDQYALDHMRAAVQKHGRFGQAVEMFFDVVEGKAFVEILRHSRDKDIDLVMLGRGADGPEGAKLATRLVRRSPCSVIIVPQHASLDVKKILVPIDFSKPSDHAFEAALDIAAGIGVSRIDCVHVYGVPAGFHKTGKTRDEFAAIMRANAEKEFDVLMAETAGKTPKGVGVRRHYILSDDPKGALIQCAEEMQSDLTVIAVRGRSRTASFLFLGSVAEHLIHNTKAALLTVKKKGANLGILDMLLGS